MVRKGTYLIEIGNTGEAGGDAELLEETFAAVKLRIESDQYGSIEGWFPKSQIVIDERNSYLEIPKWLLKKNRVM